VSRHHSARLFVAIDLPSEVREQLAAWARIALRPAGGRPGTGHPLRVLDADLLHVTMCFLGNRPVEEIETIGSRMSSVTGEACELSLGAPLWLPARRPRVLAVELHDDSGELERLHHDLVAALREVCDLDGDTHGSSRRHHRFHPHVTVARMHAGAAPRRRALEPTPALSFMPRELVLYRSLLSPAGASYEAIRRCPLC
jgi:RNA 2',3'-cyclic 3'-phosphodiesterase